MTSVTEREMPAMQWMRTQLPELRNCYGGGREGGRWGECRMEGQNEGDCIQCVCVCVCVQCVHQSASTCMVCYTCMYCIC